MNPKRLEPFKIAREKELKEQSKTIDFLAWAIGSYVIDSIGHTFGSNHTYPSTPRSYEDEYIKNEAPKSEVMSDGAKFMAFMSVHNRDLAKKRNQVDNTG